MKLGDLFHSHKLVDTRDVQVSNLSGGLNIITHGYDVVEGTDIHIYYRGYIDPRFELNIICK